MPLVSLMPLALTPGNARAHGAPLEVQARGEAELGRLIVFVQDGPISAAFQESVFPQIRDLTAELRIPIQTVDATLGAPAEITHTPMIVFQNYLGRSIYQGRPDDLQHLKVFIRTGRYITQSHGPKAESVIEMRDVAVLPLGRAKVVATLEVGALMGAMTAGLDDRRFHEDALKSLTRGFTSLRATKKTAVRRGDRLFHIAVFPTATAGGGLRVSAEVYADSDRSRPIYAYPVPSEIEAAAGHAAGPGPDLPEPTVAWDDRERAFKEAAPHLERAILAWLGSAAGGEGLEPIGSELPEVAWTDLQLPLPPRIEERVNPAAQAALGSRWSLAPSDRDYPPQIMMSMPEPFDRYRAVADVASGTLELGADVDLEGAHGVIEVTLDSLTTGRADLDAWLRSAAFLDTRRFPTARFEVEALHSSEPGRALAVGSALPATIDGRLAWRGRSVAMTLPATFEPVIDHHGSPQLLVSTRLQVDLGAFGVSTILEGPVPQARTVRVEVNLVFLLDRETGAP